MSFVLNIKIGDDSIACYYWQHRGYAQMFTGYDDMNDHFSLSIFSEYFKCVEFEDKRSELDYGGKILLPPSALEKLIYIAFDGPMTFKLTNEVTKKSTCCGVLEFVSREGTVSIPKWLMKTLQTKPGEIINITTARLAKGSFIKIQPQSVDFLDISDPRAVLENAMRNFITLSLHDMIDIYYNEKVFSLEIVECKPRESILIMDVDLQVDFAPPIGYVEDDSSKTEKSIAGSFSAVNIDHPLSLAASFKGEGRQVQTKRKVVKVETPTDLSCPALLKLPPNKLFFGSIESIKPFVPNNSARQRDPN